MSNQGSWGMWKAMCYHEETGFLTRIMTEGGGGTLLHNSALKGRLAAEKPSRADKKLGIQPSGMELTRQTR